MLKKHRNWFIAFDTTMKRLMKSLPLFLRVYGERTNGVWSLICLEFNLAVQAESLNEAKQKLRSMVKTYITDALSEDGPDRAFASTFLRRRAPTIFWLKYYVFSVVYWLRGNKGGCGYDHVLGSDPIPMIPAGV